MTLYLENYPLKSLQYNNKFRYNNKIRYNNLDIINLDLDIRYSNIRYNKFRYNNKIRYNNLDIINLDLDINLDIRDKTNLVP